jgi:hypothetical protein
VRDYPVEIIPKYYVTHSNGLCAACTRNFQVFAAPHCKKEGHVRELLKTPSQCAFCWQCNQFLEQAEWDRFLGLLGWVIVLVSAQLSL